MRTVLSDCITIRGVLAGIEGKEWPIRHPKTSLISQDSSLSCRKRVHGSIPNTLTSCVSPMALCGSKSPRAQGAAGSDHIIYYAYDFIEAQNANPSWLGCFAL